MILLPSHRERANNSMYYNMAENGQVGQMYSGTCPRQHAFIITIVIQWLIFILSVAFVFQNNHMQRALFQQVSPCKPCADPHMNLPEKGAPRTAWDVQYYVQHMRCSAVCWHVNVFPLQCFPTLPAAGVWTERTGSRCPTCRLLPEGLSCPLSHPGPSHQVPSLLLVLCWEHKPTLSFIFPRQSSTSCFSRSNRAYWWGDTHELVRRSLESTEDPELKV